MNNMNYFVLFLYDFNYTDFINFKIKHFSFFFDITF